MRVGNFCYSIGIIDNFIGKAHAQLLASYADLIGIVQGHIHQILQLVDLIVELLDVQLMLSLFLHDLVILHQAPKKKNDGKEKQQQDKQQMSKENAEQMLNAAIQEEKQTQELNSLRNIPDSFP